jgi:hypothetical protein
MITFPNYLDKLKTIKHINQLSMQKFGISFVSTPLDGAYNILWGTPEVTINGASLETGFFWEAAHIDKLGLYQYSSLNSPEAWDEIESFKPLKNASDIILCSPTPSKYQQTAKYYNWDGVVLACQNPTDRSVLSVGSTEDYYQFIEEACAFYGKNLFLKLHPWNSTPEVLTRLHNSANKYGCMIDKCNHSVIECCEFVLVYNSTFSVDCFIRGIPVVQYAPGYFYKTPAVLFTDRKFIEYAGMTIAAGFKLVNFLIWRYCFNYMLSPDMWYKIATTYANTSDLFPLPIELSYANYDTACIKV